ncbi:hypothetical protein [Thermodesulfovibrio sp. Kuro-1]|uniref:hypothetical protein n=1 Tax=Thermodesulfovibrio sp. Kuro-1 TaxID=2580394 RepID=UPI0015E850B3|nr:hypothetical protein [Thermodesulfovibrio sp. Kuro-1]
MNALNMILKLREWEEELEKQKFIGILTERQRMEGYLRELEERFRSVGFLKESNSMELLSIYNEMQYLLTRLKEAQEIMQKIDEELQAQRQIYEEAFKERKKIEQLYDRLINTIKMQRQKLEEKLISDVFISRLRS